MLRAAIVLVFVGHGVARAQSSVDVALSPDGKAAAAALGYSEADFAKAIQTKVDDAYQTNNVPGFLRSLTNATSFSQRGLGVDYVSAPNSFIVGIAANASVASDTLLTSNQRPTSGGATVNFAAMAGANLGEWGAPRWTVYANGFYQTASTDRLSGTLTSFGAHAQLVLLEPEDRGGADTLVRWIGLDATSGLELTRWAFGANQSGVTNNFDIAPASGGGGGATTVTLVSKGAFDLRSTAVTLPIEVTTGLRIALIASLFVGAGFDLTVGTSSLNSSLMGDVSTSDGKNLGTVKISATGSNSPSPAAVRILAGVQLNLWKLKFFVQGNVSQTPAASIAAGIRLVI